MFFIMSILTGGNAAYRPISYACPTDYIVPNPNPPQPSIAGTPYVPITQSVPIPPQTNSIFQSTPQGQCFPVPFPPPNNSASSILASGSILDPAPAPSNRGGGGAPAWLSYAALGLSALALLLPLFKGNKPAAQAAAPTTPANPQTPTAPQPTNTNTGDVTVPTEEDPAAANPNTPPPGVIVPGQRVKRPEGAKASQPKTDDVFLPTEADTATPSQPLSQSSGTKMYKLSELFPAVAKLFETVPAEQRKVKEPIQGLG
jgi:hypothetical protein